MIWLSRNVEAARAYRLRRTCSRITGGDCGYLLICLLVDFGIDLRKLKQVFSVVASGGAVIRSGPQAEVVLSIGKRA